jgi:hypothetical protein
MRQVVLGSAAPRLLLAARSFPVELRPKRSRSLRTVRSQPALAAEVTSLRARRIMQRPRSGTNRCDRAVTEFPNAAITTAASIHIFVAIQAPTIDCSGDGASSAILPRLHRSRPQCPLRSPTTDRGGPPVAGAGAVCRGAALQPCTVHNSVADRQLQPVAISHHAGHDRRSDVLANWDAHHYRVSSCHRHCRYTPSADG